MQSHKPDLLISVNDDVVDIYVMRVRAGPLQDVGTTAVLRAAAAGGLVNICRCSIMDPDYEFYNYYSRCRLNI